MNDKKCKICNLTKSINEFSPAAKYKDKQYYRGECKQCNQLKQRSDQTSQIKYRNSEHGKQVKSNYKKRLEYCKKQTAYTRKRYKEDKMFAVKHNIRRRLSLCLKRKYWLKSSKFAEYIGCSQNELKVHLESKFAEGMTWQNYGKWHVDHIIPMDSATSEEEMYKLCHYTNLQPLWAADNIKKSNKL